MVWARWGTQAGLGLGSRSLECDVLTSEGATSGQDIGGYQVAKQYRVPASRDSIGIDDDTLMMLMMLMSIDDSLRPCPPGPYLEPGTEASLDLLLHCAAGQLPPEGVRPVQARMIQVVARLVCPQVPLLTLSPPGINIAP
jgi:hypothetical protein